jgi:hypothetical protein
MQSEAEGRAGGLRDRVLFHLLEAPIPNTPERGTVRPLQFAYLVNLAALSDSNFEPVNKQ